MKQLLFLLMLTFCSYHGFSQENPYSNNIQTSIKVKALEEKKAEYHRRTNGELDGYRVKIHFGADRTKAREVKARFSNMYSDVPTYEDYQQPNFVINVGNFKTKIEAYELLKRIKSDFPYAFIVKSKVQAQKFN